MEKDEEVDRGRPSLSSSPLLLSSSPLHPGMAFKLEPSMTPLSATSSSDVRDAGGKDDVELGFEGADGCSRVLAPVWEGESQRATAIDLVSPSPSLQNLRLERQMSSSPSAKQRRGLILPTDGSRARRATSLPLLERRRVTMQRRSSISNVEADPAMDVGQREAASSSGPEGRLLRERQTSATPLRGQEAARTDEPVPSSSRLPSVPPLEVDTRDAVYIAEWTASPPRRNLRSRKPAQLAPYTTEMQRYKRRLVRNDWQDAVVMEREYLRAQREKRREREGGEVSPVPGHQSKRRREQKSAGKETAEVVSSSRDRALPLQERRNGEEVIARFGGAISSSSEDEVPVYEGADGLGTVTVELSPPASTQAARLPNRKRPHNALRSESESSPTEVHEVTDDSTTSDDEEPEKRITGRYKQQWRLLRRTMPRGAATLHILDLMEMHREAEEALRQPDHGLDERSRSVEQSEPESLRPGESRKRAMVVRDWQDVRLIEDGDEESDDSTVATAVSSDPESRKGSSVREDDFSEQWLYPLRGGRQDSIDRMLTSARGSATGRKKTRAGGQKRRQERGSMTGADWTTSRLPRPPAKKKAGRTTYQRGRSSKRPVVDNGRVDKAWSGPRYSLLRDEALFDGLVQPVLPGNERSAAAKRTPEWSRDSSWNRNQVSLSVSPLPASPSTRLSTPRDRERAGAMLWTPPTDVDRRPTMGAKRGPSRQVQKRLELPVRQTVDLSLPHFAKQQAEMEVWQEVSDLRVDFGLLPPCCGISFQAGTYLGRGRLFELLQLAKEGAQIAESMAIGVFGVHLDPELCSYEEVQAVLESAKQQLLALIQAEETVEAQTRFATSLSELLRFLLVWLTEARGGREQVERVRECGREHVEEFIGFLKASRPSFAPLVLQSLRWFKVELDWREAIQRATSGEAIGEARWGGTDLQSHFTQSCQDLILELLIHGLNHTMQSVKRASVGMREAEAEGEAVELSDQSAQLWICLLHLLSQDACTELFGPYCTFWHLFEAAMGHYQSALSHTKGPLVLAENGWYCLLAICSLSYFSASTGASTSQSCLKRSHWPLVLHNLSHLRLRLDEEIESSQPMHALQMRDGYIRLLLSRVLLLSTVWGWKYEGSEPTLGKLFALFDRHKLQDLPSESGHDFPAFLRLYEESRLMDAVGPDDTAFGILLKILARAAFDLRAMEGGEKNVARLFSRFSPVRTMAFSREVPPTTLERSALFNHYSIALVYLHLVPASHHQRLLQIQQYLSFSRADEKSQVVCIRAMMYAITVLQHHRLAIRDAVGWFKAAFTIIAGRLEDLHREGARTGGELKWEREERSQRTLLVAALRSIEYVIKTDSLDKARDMPSYPDLQLLDLSWTSKLLESQLTVQATELALEVCHLLQAFLVRRSLAIPGKEGAKRANSGSDDNGGDSQDSYADLFDDVDFDDALLMGAAGYKDTDMAIEGERQRQDWQFAQLLHTALSPSIFRLLSNLFHPERVSPYTLAKEATPSHRAGQAGYLSLLHSMFEQSTRTSLAETIIDTWSWCAWIMVEESKVRPWSYYFTYGPEDPKRLQGEVSKRDVTLRFLAMISTRCLQLPLSSCLQTYGVNMVEIWNNFMASLAACSLSSQHVLCNNLRELEGRRDGDGGLLDRVNWQGKLRWSLDDFEVHRLSLLQALVDHFAARIDLPPTSSPRALFFSSITALLVSIRVYAGEARVGEEYIAFCRAIVHLCRSRLGETLLRGVGLELNKTEGLVEAVSRRLDRAVVGAHLQP